MNTYINFEMSTLFRYKYWHEFSNNFNWGTYIFFNGVPSTGDCLSKVYIIFAKRNVLSTGSFVEILSCYISNRDIKI